MHIIKKPLLPAQLFEKSVRTFRLKGPLRIGMEITVFDLATIAAETTYKQQHSASVRVQTFLADVRIVIQNREIRDHAFLGQHVLKTLLRNEEKQLKNSEKLDLKMQLDCFTDE